MKKDSVAVNFWYFFDHSLMCHLQLRTQKMNNGNVNLGWKKHSNTMKKFICSHERIFFKDTLKTHDMKSK